MAVSANDKRLVRSKSGLKIVSLSEDVESPLTLTEPEWIPDNECLHCKNCKAKFDFLNRRHHCRRCGDCYCSGCCNNMMPLPRMCFVDPVRHCKQCAQLSNAEMDFFDRQIKQLHKGATFQVKSKTLVPNVDAGYTSKLSMDQRFLTFDASEIDSPVDAVDLMLIESFQILTSTDHQGNPTCAGVQMKFRDSCGENQSIALENQDPITQKQNTQWINSLHQAMKYILQKKNLK